MSQLRRVYKDRRRSCGFLDLLLSSVTMARSTTLWLVLGFASVPLSHAQVQGSVVINDRTIYHAHARNEGMCHKRNDPSRVLVVPGPDVVSKFSVCQGRNEFGELVADTSGSVYCNGTVRISACL